MLGSENVSEKQIRGAAEAVEEACMDKLLSMEIQVGIKKPDATRTSRQRAHVLGVAMRYQKYLKEKRVQQMEQRKKQRLNNTNN